MYSCVASIGSSESLAASACVPLTGSREPGVHMCPSSTSLLPWALHCCFQHDVRYMYLSAFTVGGVPGVSLAVFACRTAPIERCVTLACTFLDPYILLASSSAACTEHGENVSCTDISIGHCAPFLLASFLLSLRAVRCLPCYLSVFGSNTWQFSPSPKNVNSQRVVHNARKKRHKQDKQNVDPSDRRDSCTLFVKA